MGLMDKIEKAIDYSYTSKADREKFENEQKDNTPVEVMPVITDKQILDEVLAASKFVRSLRRK